ncbi:MAG: H(+)/Cl(-) exchange transporter ClcA [Bacteroidota bacterium]|jgi:CIC family chloride channel protein
MKFRALFKRFLIWRIRHISQRQFVYLLSILVGFTSGVGAVIMKNLTHFFQHLLEGNLVQYYHQAFYFVFPIIGLSIVYFIIRKIIRKKVSHGIPSTLFAISKKKGIMARYQMYGSLLTAPITVGFGGSVGLEGPTVATGTAISSNLSRFFHMNQSERNLLIGCAAAGAMSSIFKAPIAALVFAIEVFGLDLTIGSMIPLLLASISAIVTSYFFFGSDVLLPFDIKNQFAIGDIPFYIILGLIAGVISIYFTEVYSRIQKIFDTIKSPIKRLFIGGGLLGILLYLIPPLYGEGFDVINSLVNGKPNEVLQNNILHLSTASVGSVILLLSGLVLFKIIASSLTFGAGGVGGIFAPTLFMGSIMGYTVGKLINHLGILKIGVSESHFTLVGMAGLMAGVLHAPLTAIFLIAELTGGYDLIIPLMITATISFAITKYVHPHSVYNMELGRKGELVAHNKDQAVLTLMEMDSVIEDNFIPVRQDWTLGELINNAIVKSNRNLFPVTDKSNQLIGIVLLDDIREFMFDTSRYETTRITDFMRAAPAHIQYGEDSMQRVMQKFQDSAAWNLPVLRDGKYVGFISKSKLLTAYRRKLINLTH